MHIRTPLSRMNSKCLLLRTGSGSIPVNVPTVRSSHRPSVSPSVHGVSSMRRSCSIPEMTTLTKQGLRSAEELITKKWKRRRSAQHRSLLPRNDQVGFNQLLLLRNYAKYLHEVEGDFVKAEEYYGRAILGSPVDGVVLWLYGKLMIWETQRDESRARSYFTRALQASPHDSMVLGSYAHFLWETENRK